MNDARKSLFTYGPSGDWELFYDSSYIPAFESTFSTPELQDQANDICGNDPLCIFDIAATGGIEIGRSTVESVQEQERLRELFTPSKEVNYKLG